MRGGGIAIGVSGREGKGRKGEGKVKGAVALESFLDIILSGHKSHLYGVHRRRYGYGALWLHHALPKYTAEPSALGR